MSTQSILEPKTSVVTLLQRSLVAVALMAGTLPFAASHAKDSEEVNSGKSIHHVNQGIDLPNGARADELHSVNGSITVGDNAVITLANTVNGSVRIGHDAQTQKLSTVNGRVIVGKRTIVAGDITTVNGRIEVGEEAVVKGTTKNVNSEISIGQRAHVTGEVITDNGDITLENNARVDGGIRLKTYSNWFTDLFGDIFEFHSHTPVITIGAGAEVGGDLVFDRKVKLKVHSTAKIGTVKGAIVERF